MDCWYVRLTTSKTVRFVISIAVVAILIFCSSLVSAQSISAQVNDTTSVSDSISRAKSEAERLSHSVNTAKHTIDSVRNSDYKLPARKIYSERYLQSYRDSIEKATGFPIPEKLPPVKTVSQEDFVQAVNAKFRLSPRLLPATFQHRRNYNRRLLIS